MRATAPVPPLNPRLSDRLVSQGVMMFAGISASQILSFLRNAIIGHILSKGDFGIAACITLSLQLVEQLTDVGADRLIVQAADGATARFVAAAHTLLVARGVVLTALLFITAPWIAGYFDIADATPAFQIAALQPLAKGFMHLDYRVAQRHLRNLPQVLVEFVPQLVSVILVLPFLALTNDYTSVAYLAVAQGIAAVLTSHHLATTPYRWAFDADMLRRQFRFGWPILISAIPLMAVYHGDRAIIARIFGMEDLAAFTAAFMITMVPGLLAAKIAHALLLPLFAEGVQNNAPLKPRLTVMTEAVVVMAGLYIMLFVIAGGQILPLAFGGEYADQGTLVAALAIMWGLRMIQAVPGMALMAYGHTRPFAIAGLLRGLALPFVLYAALHGGSLVVIASIGCIFEGISLCYVAMRLNRTEPGYGAVLLRRAAYLIPVIAAALVVLLNFPLTPAVAITAAALGCAATTAAALTLMPLLRNSGLAQFRKALAQTETYAATSV